jgi:uncharacterized membrane protein YhfC
LLIGNNQAPSKIKLLLPKTQLPDAPPINHHERMNALPMNVFVFVGVATIELALLFGSLVFWRRRTGARWAYFGIGVATFFVMQVVLRIPLVQLAGMALGNSLQSSKVLLFTWLGMLSLTAGLAEEGGRYLALRYLFKPPHRFAGGVMYGLGHGGIELLLFGVVTMVSNTVLCILPAEQLPAAVAGVKEQVMTMALHLPFVSAAERVMGLLLQIALSLVVLRAVNRRGEGAKWLGIAIALHFTINFMAVAMAQFTSIYVVEGCLALVTVALVCWIVKESKSDRALPTG